MSVSFLLVSVSFFLVSVSFLLVSVSFLLVSVSFHGPAGNETSIGTAGAGRRGNGDTDTSEPFKLLRAELLRRNRVWNRSTVTRRSGAW